VIPVVPPLVDVEASLVEWVESACGAEEVEVHWLGLDEPVEGELFWEGAPCRPSPELRLTVDGSTRYTLRPRLTVWVVAPVAAGSTEADQPVDTELGLVPIERIHGRPVHGRWLARVALEAGDPVTDAVVAPLPDVRKGASVDLQVQRGTLQITAPGRLLEDARLGERVRVVNEATRVTLRGVLVASDTVEIQ